MTPAQKVALKYVKIALSIQATFVSSILNNSLTAVSKYKDELVGLDSLITDLVAAGEARRLGRVTPIRASEVKFDGQRISAVTTGETGNTYLTHITLPPRRGHHCTCPDWVQNGKRVGPCKHVLALGLYWRDNRLDPAMTRLQDALTNILEHSEI